MIFAFWKVLQYVAKIFVASHAKQIPTNSPTTMDGVKLEGNDTQFSIRRDKFEIPRKPARRLRL